MESIQQRDFMFVFNESTSDHQYDFLLFLNQTSSHPSLSKYRLFAFLLHFITVSLILVFLDVRCEMSLSVKYTAHFIRAWTGLKAKGGIFHYFLCLKEFYFWGSTLVRVGLESDSWTIIRFFMIFWLPKWLHQNIISG